MINYIVEYQNSFVFNNLFTHLFVDMMNKNIAVRPLLVSELFHLSFDFDDDLWPSMHLNLNKMLVPYNDSQFQLIFKYPLLFRDLWLEEQKEKTA